MEILKENQGYYETADYLLGRLADITTDGTIGTAAAVKMIQPFCEAIKEAEEIGSFDRLHGDRFWRYTIVETDRVIKITADNGIEIKLIVKNK